MPFPPTDDEVPEATKELMARLGLEGPENFDVRTMTFRDEEPAQLAALRSAGERAVSLAGEQLDR